MRQAEKSPENIYLLLSLLFKFFILPAYTQNKNPFLIWAQEYAQDSKQTNCWVGGVLPTSSTSGLPQWVFPLQGDDWNLLQIYIYQERASFPTLTQDSRWDVSQWPIHSTRNKQGHRKSFSKEEADKALLRYVVPSPVVLAPR